MLRVISGTSCQTADREVAAGRFRDVMIVDAAMMKSWLVVVVSCIPLCWLWVLHARCCGVIRVITSSGLPVVCTLAQSQAGECLAMR